MLQVQVMFHHHITKLSVLKQSSVGLIWRYYRLHM